MHNWLLLYICQKNTYQSAVLRSISQYLAPKFASLSQPQKPEVVWVGVRIWDRVRVTVRDIVTVRVRFSKTLGSG